MQVNNLGFHVRIRGEGPPFIWGHGLTANMASEDATGLLDWDRFPRDRKVVRYDARGHGQTEPTFCPGDYHWENLARDMIAVADELGIESFIAGGQSMGCATAIYTGRIAPERIERLVLMNPPTAWETRTAQAAFYNKMARIGGLLGGKVLARIMGRRLERLVPGWLVEAKGQKIEGVLEGLRPLKRKTLFNLFKGAALTDLPPREEIQSIDIPSLILGWTGDPTHPIETAVELHRLLPRSTLVVAEGYSDFEKWPKLIRDFVSKSD